MSKALIDTALGLLEGLVAGNSRVQNWVIDHFDVLCKVKISAKALAQMLRKVQYCTLSTNIQCFSQSG